MNTEELETAVDDQELPQGGANDTTQSGDDTTAPPNPPPAKSEEWKEAIKDLAGQVKTLTAPKKEERQLTQDELNEKWGVFNPEKADPAFFKKFFGIAEDASPESVAERKAVFALLQTGLTKQAIIGARNIFQEELAKRDEQIKQLLEYHGQAQSQSIRQQFETAYPALSDKRYAKLLAANATALNDREFRDAAEYFKVLAESTAEDIKQFDPAFDLGAQPTKSPAGNTPRLPRTTAGGTGGAGGGRTAPKTSNDDVDSLS